MTDLDRIRAYYAQFPEWDRLDTAEGMLELGRARSLLRTHLKSNSRILDLGGGPGRYAIALAKWGHMVTLADLSPSLLEIAREKIAAAGALSGKIESLDVVNAVDLGCYADASFDAVVAFGPFYHLLAEAERSAAAREIFRVLRPNGLALTAFIPRLSAVMGLIERAAHWPHQVPAGTLTAAASSGAFHNGGASGFQEGYFPAWGEMEELFAAQGFKFVDLVSLRSIACRLEATLEKLDDGVAAEVAQLIEQFSREREIVATSGHAVLICRKGQHGAEPRDSKS
jgi:S-adenosylmethionine-dependent methyltransferase